MNKDFSLSDSLRHHLLQGYRVFIGLYGVDPYLEELALKEISHVVAAIEARPPVAMLQTALQDSGESQLLARFLQENGNESLYLGEVGELFRFSELERNAQLWRNLMENETGAFLALGTAIDTSKSVLSLPGGRYVPACHGIKNNPEKLVSYTLISLNAGALNMGDPENADSEFVCVRNSAKLRSSLEITDAPVYLGDFLILPRF